MSSVDMLQRLPSVGVLPFRIGIIGGGRVGGAIAGALEPHLAWMVVRSPWRRRDLRRMLPRAPMVGTIEEIAVLPEMMILAVPDRVISTLARELAEHFSDRLRGTIVVHLAGALLASELSSIEVFGGKAVAAHPFTVVPEPHPAWLYGAVWGIEGNQAALPHVEQLIRALGGRPFYLGTIDADRKALYHLAAVLASNIPTTAISAAAEVAQAAGIPPELFLPPILRATVESAVMSLQRGNPPARTGPLARGDTETVSRHFAALTAYPDLRRQYELFIAAMQALP